MSNFIRLSKRKGEDDRTGSQERRPWKFPASTWKQAGRCGFPVSRVTREIYDRISSCASCMVSTEHTPKGADPQNAHPRNRFPGPRGESGWRGLRDFLYPCFLHRGLSATEIRLDRKS